MIQEKSAMFFINIDYVPFFHFKEARNDLVKNPLPASLLDV